MAMSAAVSPTTPARDLATLENEITELAAHIHAATYRLLCLIREFDARGGWSGPGLRSCAHWLNWRTGIALGAAREKLRVAHALPDLPLISEAFRSGRVSFSKVRAMTRVATPENEDYLLMIATHGTASHVERLVRNYRQVKRTEALAQENTHHDYRELSWYSDDDGSYVLRARLTPEQGARVTQALDAALDAARDERSDVSAETPEPVAARRADALARVAEGFLQPGTKAHSGGRATVNVHTDMTVLRADGEGVDSELAGGGRLCAGLRRRADPHRSVMKHGAAAALGAGEGVDAEAVDKASLRGTIPHTPIILRRTMIKQWRCSYSSVLSDRGVICVLIQPGLLRLSSTACIRISSLSMP